MSVLAKSYDLLLNEGEEGELIYLLTLLSCKGWYLQKLLGRSPTEVSQEAALGWIFKYLPPRGPLGPNS